MNIPRELAKLIRDSSNLRGLLDEAVSLVAKRMAVDVCSIYLLDPADDRLWLVASHGFRPEAVGQVSMGLGEGLTGQVVRDLATLAVSDAGQDPRYRHFSETGEEDFHSYLGEPFALGQRPVGAIVLRTRSQRDFTVEDSETLAAIASQLVGLVENVRLVEALGEPSGSGQAYWREIERWYEPTPPPASGPRGRETLHGNGTSAGIVLAEAVVVDRRPFLREASETCDEVEERDRLSRALARARTELEAVQDFTRRTAGEDTALIFGSHLLFLADHGLVHRLESALAEGGSADSAVEDVLSEIAAQLAEVRDPYIRQRSGDILDLRDRLLGALDGLESPPTVVRDRIAVIPSLTASAVVELHARGAVGLVAEHGAPTAHGAILARSFGLPVVAGVPEVLAHVATGDRLAIDGTEGTVLVRPDAEVEESVEAAIADRQSAMLRREHLRDLEAVTLDGRRIVLLANVGFGADVRRAADRGAEGVGLYRTEMPFLVRDAIPTRAEQARLYAKVFDVLPGRPVTFRTLDLGGDKFLRTREAREANPFLGHRSIRLSLDHPADFIAQVQAFQIAARNQDGRIMLPLVSQVAEVRRAKELIQQASDMLRAEGVSHHADMPLGVMIEVPAAVEIAHVLAREVSFFSIGTNDLVQYTVAVDRTNERVAHLGDHCHPAVLSMIRRTIVVGETAGIPVSVCGEMAGDPATALLLVGLGVDRLSMNPGAIPAVKEAIRAAHFGELRDRAQGLLALDGPAEVRAAWPPLAGRAHEGLSVWST